MSLETSSPASAYITTNSLATGSNWNGPIWKLNLNDTTFVAGPTAGNTYTAIANGVAWGNSGANTRLLNPAIDGLQTFAGDSLTLNTNTELRFKRGASTDPISATIPNFPGLSANPGLILNGGALNPGDDAIFIVTGKVQAAASSILSGGNNGGGEQRIGRAIYFRGALSGAGDLRIVQSDPSTPYQSDADASSYNGNWLIQDGALKGLAPLSGNTSLGAGSILVTPTNLNSASVSSNYAQFEVMFDLSTPGSLVLSNNPVSGSPAIMVLHQNCAFGSVIINGTPLSYRTYAYSELAASFPANFPSGGSGSITVQPPAPPPAPGNVLAINGDTRVLLSWTAPAYAAGYLINRSGTAGGPYTIVGSSGTTNFTDTGLINRHTYYYVIVATNSLGASPNSTEVIGNPNPVVTGITAVGGTNQVALAWNTLPNSSSYSVKRASSGGGPFVDIATGLTATSYVDMGLASGKTYYYRISAVIIGGGLSGQSAQVSGTTAPGAPGNLTAMLFAATALRVGWTEADPVSQFNIEQSADGVNFSPLAAQPGSTFAYTNTGLSGGMTFYYRVQAQNAGGFSGYSPVISSTTPTNGWNINFANNPTNSSQNQTVSPAPPGYLQDLSIDFGDQGNGFSYGWTTAGGTNISADSRWRQDATSPDIRYDTFAQMQKGGSGEAAVWELAVPNGFYWVHLVAGDPQATDSAFQFNVEGVLTPATAYVPTANPAPGHWGEFTNTVLVNDGRLTITSGPNATNNKLNYIDIYPASAVPIMVTADPVSPPPIYENRQITLSVAIAPVRPLAGAYEGYQPVFYQWYKDGNPVPNGTNATLAVGSVNSLQGPLVQTGDAGGYYAIITNFAGSVTSQTATVTVLVDNDPPVMLSAGSVDGNSLGVCFDEFLDPTTAPSPSPALDPLKYAVSDGDGAVTVSAVTLRPDGKSVLVTLGRTLRGNFSVAAHADDIKGAANTGFQNGAGKVPGLTPKDVGYDPAGATPGSTYSCKEGEFDVVTGGIDISGNADQGHLTLQSRSNEWDVIVRVQSLTISDPIARAGLMARQSFDSNAPMVYMSVNPPPPGRDLGEAQARLTTGGAAAAWPIETNYAPAGIPNAWQRMTRAGNLITGYSSSNGVDWVLFAQTTNIFTDPALVGFATTAHNTTNGLTKAQYRNFHFVAAPAITSGPTNITLDPGGSASFAASATGPTEGGALTYQWRKNGVDIPGATNTTYAIGNAQFADAGSYDLRAVNSGGRTYSSAATLIVRDTIPPVLSNCSNITLQCAGPVSLSVSATDNKDGALSATCVPPSNSSFPRGTTTVNCSATDSSSNSVNCSFTVTIHDTNAPVLTCPANFFTPCTGSGQATVSYTVTRTDNCAGSSAPVCSVQNSVVGNVHTGVFPVGTTTVTCQSTDLEGNTGSCSFTVTVMDITPPNVTCPANITVTTTNQAGSVVTYSTTVSDVCDPQPGLVCSPISGSNFPMGVTTVNCTATDANHNSAGCSFNVTIRLPNTAPVLGAISNQVVHAGRLIILNLTATDAEGNNLTYALDQAPPTATLDASRGILTWQTLPADIGTTNQIKVHVTDDGSPPLSTTNNFTIQVVGPPRILSITNSGNLQTLRWSAIPGALYILQGGPRINQTRADLSGLIRAAADPATTNDNSLDPARFYSIAVVPEYFAPTLVTNRFSLAGAGAALISATSSDPTKVGVVRTGAAFFDYRCLAPGTALIRYSYTIGAATLNASISVTCQ